MANIAHLIFKYVTMVTLPNLIIFEIWSIGEEGAILLLWENLKAWTIQLSLGVNLVME